MSTSTARTSSKLCAFAACFCLSGFAAAGAVSGTITVSGVKPGAPFTITIYAADDSVAGQITMNQSGPYSIDLAPGRYKVRCTSPASKTPPSTEVYLFALDGPITRNLSVGCG